MKWVARVVAWSLAVLGVIVLLTDWIDWPWWAGLILGSPLGLLFLLDEAIGDLFDGFGGDGDGSFDVGVGGDAN